MDDIDLDALLDAYEALPPELQDLLEGVVWDLLTAGFSYASPP